MRAHTHTLGTNTNKQWNVAHVKRAGNGNKMEQLPKSVAKLKPQTEIGNGIGASASKAKQV